MLGDDVAWGGLSVFIVSLIEVKGKVKAEEGVENFFLKKSISVVQKFLDGSG